MQYEKGRYCTLVDNPEMKKIVSEKEGEVQVFIQMFTNFCQAGEKNDGCPGT